MYIYLTISAFGALLYLFIFWRKLKDDYIANQIFSTGILSLIVAGVLFGVSYRFLPQWWFWASLSGMLLAIAISIMRFKMRVYETLEAFFVALLPWIFLIFLSDAIINQSIYSLGFAFVVIIVGLIYLFLNSKYKEFSWYSSGRVGFAGLTAAGIFFLLRGIIAIIFPSMLSFVGKIDAIISGIVAFVIFLAVFNLAREK